MRLSDLSSSVLANYEELSLLGRERIAFGLAAGTSKMLPFDRRAQHFVRARRLETAIQNHLLSKDVKFLREPLLIRNGLAESPSFVLEAEFNEEAVRYGSGRAVLISDYQERPRMRGVERLAHSIVASSSSSGVILSGDERGLSCKVLSRQEAERIEEKIPKEFGESELDFSMPSAASNSIELAELESAVKNEMGLIARLEFTLLKSAFRRREPSQTTISGDVFEAAVQRALVKLGVPAEREAYLTYRDLAGHCDFLLHGSLSGSRILVGEGRVPVECKHSKLGKELGENYRREKGGWIHQGMLYGLAAKARGALLLRGNSEEAHAEPIDMSKAEKFYDGLSERMGQIRMKRIFSEMSEDLWKESRAIGLAPIQLPRRA